MPFGAGAGELAAWGTGPLPESSGCPPADDGCPDGAAADPPPVGAGEEPVPPDAVIEGDDCAI